MKLRRKRHKVDYAKQWRLEEELGLTHIDSKVIAAAPTRLHACLLCGAQYQAVEGIQKCLVCGESSESYMNRILGQAEDVREKEIAGKVSLLKEGRYASEGLTIAQTTAVSGTMGHSPAPKAKLIVKQKEDLTAHKKKPEQVWPMDQPYPIEIVDYTMALTQSGILNKNDARHLAGGMRGPIQLRN